MHAAPHRTALHCTADARRTTWSEDVHVTDLDRNAINHISGIRIQ
jgi:hypothetical protein